MSQSGPTRSLFGMVLRNFINSFKPRKWSGELKGTDYNGTKYFEIPTDASVGRTRASRWFEPSTGAETRFDQELPAEWEAWLRGRRKHPPTEEEVLKNLEIMKLKKQNAIAVEAKAGKKTPMTKGMESFPTRTEYEYFPGTKKPDKD